MTTVADLKALTWVGGAHADGSDKGGRFSINFASADFKGERIDASKKLWRSGGGESTYMFRGATFPTLALLADFITKAIDVGDSKEARDD
jgi:hypothetical protein